MFAEGIECNVTPARSELPVLQAGIVAQILRVRSTWSAGPRDMNNALFQLGMRKSATAISRWCKNLAKRFLKVILLPILRRLTPLGNHKRKAILYSGQCYYNAWYLSRNLRTLGWTADVLNWDLGESSQSYYHGEDFRIEYGDARDIWAYYWFYLYAVCRYDIFHFSNKGGLQFGEPLRAVVERVFGPGHEIRLLKALGKKIVYTNNGCLDGVSQTSFSHWGPSPVCGICRWRDNPLVCSDARNLEWGEFRNAMADYQILLGGNRADYNIAPTVHEVPEFYCLDSNVWCPDLKIPKQYALNKSEGSLLLYHSVGNYSERSDERGVNIKSTHIYRPLIEQLKEEGHKIEMIFHTNVPNMEVRFYQAQADIFLEMLTYGWFGANAREAMMLGKPVVCFLRPEWLESARLEIPDYIDELPIVQANPDNVREVLLGLIAEEDRRLEIGRRSRQFALKWHSAEAGGKRFNHIYSELLGLDVQP